MAVLTSTSAVNTAGKGDKRRPGKIPDGEWERIFGKKRPTKP